MKCAGRRFGKEALEGSWAVPLLLLLTLSVSAAFGCGTEGPVDLEAYCEAGRCRIDVCMANHRDGDDDDDNGCEAAEGQLLWENPARNVPLVFADASAYCDGLNFYGL